MVRLGSVRILIAASWTCVACLVGCAAAQEVFPSQPLEDADMDLTEVERGGEDEDEIETDRDSFTPATTLAGPGRTIVEAAYSFIDNRTVPETHSYPELLLRYGASD